MSRSSIVAPPLKNGERLGLLRLRSSCWVMKFVKWKKTNIDVIIIFQLKFAYQYMNYWYTYKEWGTWIKINEKLNKEQVKSFVNVLFHINLKETNRGIKQKKKIITNVQRSQPILGWAPQPRQLISKTNSPFSTLT